MPLKYNQKDRVIHVDDPDVVGTVLEAFGGKARVRWDDEAKLYPGTMYSIGELKLVDHGSRQPNPPLIHCPEIQDLEFVTRIDPKTGSLMMERDGSYRGDGAEHPVCLASNDIYKLFKGMTELDREHIVIGILNVRKELRGWKICHVGQLAGVEADAREMVKDAAFALAHSMFMLHNHPSGDPTPSDADGELTKVIEDVANGWNIELFDHVVVGRKNATHPAYRSFRDDGKLQPEEDG